MYESLFILTLAVLCWAAGLIIGGLCYQRAAEREADNGLVKLGSKFYKTELIKSKKDA